MLVEEKPRPAPAPLSMHLPSLRSVRAVARVFGLTAALCQAAPEQPVPIRWLGDTATPPPAVPAAKP